MRRKHRWKAVKKRNLKQRTEPLIDVGSLNRYERELDDALTQAMRLIEPHDGFDVVANLLLANLPLNADEYRESTHPGLIVIAELAAILLLKLGRRTPPNLRLAQRVETISFSTFTEIGDALRRCLRLGDLVGGFRLLGSERDAADFLGLAERSREVGVRGPAYPHQEEETLRELFASLSAETKETVGFTIDEALALCHLAMQLPLDQLQARSIEVGTALDAAEAQEGVDTSGAELEAATRLLGIFIGLGTTLSFTLNDLVRETELSEETVRAFLGAFSVDFGHDISPVAFFEGRNPIRTRPVIRDESGNCLLVSPPNLLFGLRGRMEEALQGSKYWKRYERRRSSYVERTAIDALENALRPDRTLRNVAWRDGDALVETDGLLLVDQTAIIVEAKGKGFRDPARRGLPAHLKHDLKKMVSEAADQISRLENRIAVDGQLTVVDERGKQEVIDFAGIREFCGIAVTLEDISVVATAGRTLSELGLRRRGAREALALPLHSLLVICEIVALPAELVHYLLRRDRLHRQGHVTAFEELDFFMYYLLKGLFFDEPRSSKEFVWLTSMTDALDEYYLSTHGPRTVPTPQPEQYLPPQLGWLLRTLDDKRPGGWLAVSLRLLDCDQPTRDLVAAQIARLERETASDRGLHDFTYTFKTPPAGVTLVAAPTSRTAEMAAFLRERPPIRKYQVKANEWFAIGMLIDGALHFHSLACDFRRWAYDAQAEVGSKRLGPPPWAQLSSRGKKKRRR